MWKAIVNLIEKWGCLHDWDLVTTTRVDGQRGAVYHSCTYCCKKCGKFHMRKDF